MNAISQLDGTPRGPEVVVWQAAAPCNALGIVYVMVMLHEARPQKN